MTVAMDSTGGNRKPTLEELKMKFKKQDIKPHKGHSAKIRSLSWCLNGRYLASASSDKTIRVWDVKGHGVDTLLGHSDTVHSVHFHPLQASILASASYDGTIKIWDTRSGSKKLIKTIELGMRAINVLWSPDAKRLAASWIGKNKKEYVGVFETRNYSAICQVEIPVLVNDICFLNATELVVTDRRGYVSIYSTEKLQKLKTRRATYGSCLCVKSNKDLGHIITGGADSVVNVFDNDLIPVASINRVESSVSFISYSHDNSLLATISSDLKIDITKSDTFEHVTDIKLVGPGLCVAWNPKQLLLAYTLDIPKSNATDGGDGIGGGIRGGFNQMAMPLLDKSVPKGTEKIVNVLYIHG